MERTLAMLNHGILRIQQAGLPIPTDSLEFYWDGALSSTASGTGNVEDLSDNNRDASFVNTPVFNSGLDGGVIQMTNTDSDYVTINGWKGLLGSGPMTVLMFARTTNSAANSNRLFSWGINTATGAKCMCRIQSNGSLRYVGTNFTVTQNLPGGGSYIGNDNNWHMFGFTMPSSATAGDIDLYMDGVATGQFMGNGSATDAVNILTNNDAAIGIDLSGDGSNPWDGYFAMFAVYSRVLSAQEIEDIYNYKAPDVGMSTI